MGSIAFLPIGPEIALLAGALLVLMAEVGFSWGRRVWAVLAGASLAAALGLSVWQWLRVDEIGPQLNFSSRAGAGTTLPMVVMDHLSSFTGLLLFAVAAVALVAAWKLVASLGTRGAEFVALFLLAVAGLHLMTISANLVMVFIGLETGSIALYILAGITREQSRSDEAAIKYFLLGSFASAVLIYGVALTFAGTGSTSIYGVGSIGQFFDTNIILQSGIALVGLALILVGLGFKVSAAPFHQWAPDVYQGAPAAAVPMMSAAVKIAGFATMARILTAAFPALTDEWAPALAVLAMVSVLVGSLGAIAQNDLKRMLAYSGVAHAGFLMTALVAGEAGIPGMWFYLATYAFALVGAFTVVSLVSGPRAAGSHFDSYNGLAQRSPFLAGMLALFMLSMGGIPLTAGFVGKLSVFSAAYAAGYLWLVILGLATSVIGLFFYLRVIVLMYFQEPVPAGAPGADTAPPRPGLAGRTVLALCGAVTLAFGLFPWPLLRFVENALPL